jgi:hypothetical protein
MNHAARDVGGFGLCIEPDDWAAGPRVYEAASIGAECPLAEWWN